MGHVRQPTQLRLKQSCEQKKLSVPIFRHVGHCSVPAFLSQSTPMHFRAATSAMLETNGTAKKYSQIDGRYERKTRDKGSLEK